MESAERILKGPLHPPNRTYLKAVSSLWPYVDEERAHLMRIWDISPKKLCRFHLLGEHTELHAIWAILTQGKKGYAKHPETRRWRGKLKALFLRHEALVREMTTRGYKHLSPLPKELASGDRKQGEYVDAYEIQIEILRKKGCGCNV